MVGNLVLKLKNNDDIFKEMKEFVIENNISSGFFVNANGSIKNFELMVSEKGASLNKQRHEGIFDVNSISGKIQLIKGKADIGMRVSVSNTGFTSFSGQLLSGKVANYLVIEIKKFDSSKIIEA